MDQLPKVSQGSISKGIWFVYNDEVNSIKVWGACFSGKEKVYLNEKPVSEKRNLKMKSEHAFVDVHGNNYEVKVLTTNIRKGIIECHFYKNGEIQKRYECRFTFGQIFKTKFIIMLLSGSIIIGVLVGLHYVPEVAIYISETQFSNCEADWKL